MAEGFGETPLPEFSYNFDAWLPNEQKSGKHIIPEPSPTAVMEFFTEWYTTAAEMRAWTPEPDPEPVEQDGKLVEEDPQDKVDRIRRNFTEGGRRQLELRQTRLGLIARVCSDSPSVETLEKLPNRVYSAFEDYVLEKLSPEA